MSPNADRRYGHDPEPRGPVGPDGLPVRPNRVYAREKLSFLDEYVPPALLATERKHERHYIDLFAGPGLNQDPDTGELFEGSALRAIATHALGRSDLHFTHATVVNLDRREHEALSRRIDDRIAAGRCQVPARRIERLNGDANRLIGRIMRGIHPRAYAFVFADIEAPNQLPWATVQQMRAQGHESVDLYVLFPLNMAINRMLSFNELTNEANAPALTRFYGSEQWREVAARRITDAQNAEMRRSLLDLYVLQLKELGWTKTVVVKDITRTGRVGLYKMIHATAHEAGGRIAEWAAGQHHRRAQLDFGLG